MELHYIEVGNYLIPAITLKPLPRQTLGKYGKLRRAFLREHRPAVYSKLLLSEELFPHLYEIDNAAAVRFAAIPDKEVAHEVILSELIYD